MKLRNDQLVVIDLEATCWQGDPPPGMVNETIEIGVCLLNLQTLKISKQESLAVRPTRSQVSDFCYQLTGWDQPSIDRLGQPLARQAQQLLDRFDSRSRMWASWGNYDRLQLTLDCDRQGVAYPLSPQHLNAKALFALLRGDSKQVGLSAAVKRCGLAFEGPPHRGDADAYNVARVLAHLLQTFRGRGDPHEGINSQT
jgi:inhibitor of KinA sporulation pathway (predicted exonuclease)